MSSIGNLASTLLHAVLPINLFPNNTTASTTAASALTSVQQPDSGQLSSFAQLANTLQQLQQNNPAQYTQVTQKIAANLQTAAQTAQTTGNTAAAGQLNKLSTDFSNASATGKLPNLQDLARAVSGHYSHHAAASNSSAVNQLLTSLQSGGSQNVSTNAASIIQSALTSAGITTSNL